MRSVAALIVAGGSGLRVGGALPKQYRRLAGTPILRRSIEAFFACPAISSVQIVIAAGREVQYGEATGGLDLPLPVTGGDTRQESVRRGLDVLRGAAPEFVLIHDAARPLVSGELIQSVISALEGGAGAAVPLLPISDSLRRWENNSIGPAMPRDRVCRAQTPQGFLYRAICEAHERFAGRNASDDITLAELSGMKIAAVAGEETNIKVTAESDMLFAECLLAGSGETRVAAGFDVHRFTAGDRIWLCGVCVPHERGLEGHSDADAGLHALTDALLGTLAGGDIGQHFPSSDARWRDAPSRLFLQHAAELVHQHGGVILHCDVTIICEQPKIGPHREAMRASVAEILGLDISRISVKATSTEGLGFTGRGDGLAAQAIATVRLRA